VTALNFRYEWEGAEGVRAPELAGTWARLEIWADNDCVTQVEDVVSRSTRRSIYCSLYPLAEWIAYNWWLLRAHTRLAGTVIHRRSPLLKATAVRRHNMRDAGDGFLWPNLFVIPEGELVRLVWLRDREAAPNDPIRYISEGMMYCNAQSVQAALAELVENVLVRLEEAEIDSSALREEWNVIKEADRDEADFCTAVAQLGRDPYSLDDSTAELIATIGNKIQPELLSDFLDAVDPDAIQAGVMWIGKTSRKIKSLSAQPSPAMEQFKAALAGFAPAATRPWLLGWEQARRLRKAIGVDAEEPFEFDNAVVITEEPNDDRGLVAFGGLTPSGGHALVAARDMPETTRRFATARAVWRFAAANQTRFLLTSAHADRQKVERAFAAELLAPASGVERFFKGGVVAAFVDDLEEAAEHFRVSSYVIQHQVENQLGLEITTDLV
jgi:hypothetical protein